MKQNQRNRYNGRYNSNNRVNTRPQTLYRNTSLESSGPCGKLHGTALQLAEKYQSAAKDALMQNDLVMAEICQQYADHYMRLQNIALTNEQANRPAPRPEAPPEARPEEPAAELALPEIVPPSDASDSSDAPDTDDSLRAADLSVPIRAIQENHAARPVRKQRPSDDKPAATPESQ